MINDLSNIQILKEDFKRERKHNAVKLPESIIQESIPKYVTYYKECYNIQKKLYREFFKIEKHPKMIKGKVYISSKSNKIHILEKLEEIKKILEKLNNVGENEENEIQVKNEITLPKYISLKNHEKDFNKYYLIYDKKTNSKRISLRSLFTKNNPININISLFLSKVEEKIFEIDEKINNTNNIKD
jgi:S-adenosylmethionine:tRNA-ribosyltransferase-isomerase (queuine synthetase)